MSLVVIRKESRRIVPVEDGQTIPVSSQQEKPGITLLRTAARTGATGYIGGDFLHAITKAHPELAITALIRQHSAATKLKELYPHVITVEGDLDDAELLSKAASESDVILSP